MEDDGERNRNDDLKKAFFWTLLIVAIITVAAKLLFG